MKSKLVAFFLVFLIVLMPIAIAAQLVFPEDKLKTASFDLVYDENGNLVQDQRYCYEYNSLNQLVRVKEGKCTSGGDVIAEYFYNHNSSDTIEGRFSISHQSKTFQRIYRRGP